MRLFKGFESKKQAQDFCKRKKGILSYEKSETEKRPKNPSFIRDCKKYLGLDPKYKYVVIYNI